MTAPAPPAVRALARDLWLVEGPRIRMYTIPFPTRMTVVRRGDGDLWLHSPIPPTPAIEAELAALGPIADIVAPNTFHHLGVDAWRRRCPNARVWAEASLVRRFPDRFDRALAGPSPWPELDIVHFAGSRVMSELIFCHRASGTLIVTDLLQNHDPALETRFWRLVKRVAGVLAPGGGVARDLRLTIRDRAAARAAVEEVLSWEFDRVVLCHGICVEEGGRAYVRRAFAWLLDR